MLTHLGEEQFRRPDDTPYPNGSIPRKKTIKTSASRSLSGTSRFDPVQLQRQRPELHEKSQVFAWQAVRPGRHGTQDGDLGFPKDEISDLPAAGKYAPIGPFGRWRLAVPKNLNQELKLSGLHAVVIDFHGFHQTYAKKPPV